MSERKRGDLEVNLILLHNVDLEVDLEVFELTDGTCRKVRKKVVTSHIGKGFKRSEKNATPINVDVGTCTYRACLPGTLVGPLVNRILAMMLRCCPRTRHRFCMRKGGFLDRHAVALQRFVRRHNAKVRMMVFNRVYKPPPPVYRSLSVSALMAPTAEKHMRQYVDSPSAPYYRRYRRGLNLDVTCPACERRHIVQLGYGTFDGWTIASRPICPPCRATASGSASLVG